MVEQKKPNDVARAAPAVPHFNNTIKTKSKMMLIELPRASPMVLSLIKPIERKRCTNPLEIIMKGAPIKIYLK